MDPISSNSSYSYQVPPVEVKLEKVQEITSNEEIKKDRFHFLHTLQRQLIRPPEIKELINVDYYPKEQQEMWALLEEAVQKNERTTAEDLRKQIFQCEGRLIEAEVKPYENPHSDSEKVINVFHEAGFLKTKPMPVVLLSHGLGINSIPLIYLALKCGANPESYKDSNGSEYSYLKLALLSKCPIAGIRLLFRFARFPIDLANGILPNNKRPTFFPLEAAFKSGRADVVRELLANGADPNKGWQRMNESFTEGPLFLTAVITSQSEIVQLFLQAGFPVNYQNAEGNTALHLAKAKKNEALVGDLLKAGADPLIVNKKQQTYGQFAEEICKTVDKKAREILIPVFKTGDFKNISRLGGLSQVVTDLLDINEAIDGQENTLLHLATMINRGVVLGIHSIRELIDLGGDIHRANKVGETPRVIFNQSIARQNEKIKSFQQLNDIFCNPMIRDQRDPTITNSLDGEGNTALHQVINVLGHSDTDFRDTDKYISQAKELIQRGAHPNYRNNKGETPFGILDSKITRQKSDLEQLHYFATFLDSVKKLGE